MRRSAEGKDIVVIAVNLDVNKSHQVSLTHTRELAGLGSWIDLLGQEAPRVKAQADTLVLTVRGGAGLCLAPEYKPAGLAGDEYRLARARSAWAFTAIGQILPTELISSADWRVLERTVDRRPAGFLAAVSKVAAQDRVSEKVHDAIASVALEFEGHERYSNVVRWSFADARLVTLVPPNHWLLVSDPSPFRASLDRQRGAPPENLESIAFREGDVVCFGPVSAPTDATLRLERYGSADRNIRATIRFLSRTPATFPAIFSPSAHPNGKGQLHPDDTVLLTNSRGGMARLCVDLGRIQSKYDCALAANLHPELPVDRHVLVKRVRVWVNADGFLTPLDFRCLESFAPGPPACWNFAASAGAGRSVEIQIRAQMVDGRNTTVFDFTRPSAARATRVQLPPEADVRLTVRVDIEDRNFHSETHHNGGADFHFNAHTYPVESRIPGRDPEYAGFDFRPSNERRLRVLTNGGRYHPQPEWSENIPHPIEQSRGQVGTGDAFSPGWFELPLPKGAQVTLTLDAEPGESALPLIPSAAYSTNPGQELAFETALLNSARVFIVRRGKGKTIIAGYPWFLDWGRDTFIAARGLIAAGMTEDVRQLLLTFAGFEHKGTLPNTIFGEDASNRDTTDAPLWFGLVCEELAAAVGPEPVYRASVNPQGAP
jgi:hypothetical protein